MRIASKHERAMYRRYQRSQLRIQSRKIQEFDLFLRVMGIRVEFTFLYNSYHTDYGGISIFLRYALSKDLKIRSRRIGIQIGKVERDFPIPKAIIAFVCQRVMGIKHYDGLEIALRDGYFRDMCGVEEVSNRTISRTHNKIHPRVMKREYRQFIVKLKEEGKVRGKRIAIDSTFLVVYGKGYIRVGKSYKPRGKKGYRLTIIYDIDSNIPIGFILAPANKVDSKMLIRAILETERLLGEDEERIYIFDKGYWKGLSFKKLNKMGIKFITRAKMYSNIAKRVDEIHFPGGKEILSIYINEDRKEIPDYDEIIRLVAFLDKDKELAKKEASKEDPDDDIDEVKDSKSRPFCLITNVDILPSSVILQLYKKRWNIENFIKDAKENFQINTFSSTNYNAILTHLYLCFYSYCLVRLFIRDVLIPSGIIAGIKKIRTHIFVRSATLITDENGFLIGINFNHRRDYDAQLQLFLNPSLAVGITLPFEGVTMPNFMFNAENATILRAIAIVPYNLFIQIPIIVAITLYFIPTFTTNVTSLKILISPKEVNRRFGIFLLENFF